MPIKDRLKDNPDFRCCHCGVEMPKRMSMTGGDGALRRGLLLVCSQCGHVSVLGDSSLHPMTKEEFLALDNQTKTKLLAVAQGVKHLVESGGIWSPFGNQ